MSTYEIESGLPMPVLAKKGQTTKSLRHSERSKPRTTTTVSYRGKWTNSVGQSRKVEIVKRFLLSYGITQQTLNALFSYDPLTGIVTRKVFMNSRAKIGDTVGHRPSDGYLRVRIANNNYSLHRIIWMMVYGYLPENQIDHINRVRDDNRLVNLRETTAYCNMRNATKQKRNKSGVTGICFTKDLTWQVTISDFNRPIYLGRFTDLTEAVCHRYAAEQCLNWNDCDVNSPAYQYLKAQGVLK